MPYRPTRFNAVVGLDLKWVKDSADQSFYLLKILDLATAFNVACIVPDKTPETCAEAFKAVWLTWNQPPDKIVTDKGSEYYTEFVEMLTNLGIRQRMVPTEAPWQHGMVERHGKVLADVMMAATTECQIKT